MQHNEKSNCNTTEYGIHEVGTVATLTCKKSVIYPEKQRLRKKDIKTLYESLKQFAESQLLLIETEQSIE